VTSGKHRVLIHSRPRCILCCVSVHAPAFTELTNLHSLDYFFIQIMPLGVVADSILRVCVKWRLLCMIWVVRVLALIFRHDEQREVYGLEISDHDRGTRWSFNSPKCSRQLSCGDHDDVCITYEPPHAETPPSSFPTEHLNASLASSKPLGDTFHKDKRWYSQMMLRRD